MTFAATRNGITMLTERMRIDNTGNVGTGTTAPAYALPVNGGGAEACQEHLRGGRGVTIQ
jgi:hypothetical protein